MLSSTSRVGRRVSFPVFPRSATCLAAAALTALSMASSPLCAEEVLRITRQSLALLQRCEERATPPSSAEIETFKESAKREEAAESKFASDAYVRECGFKSVRQFSDFRIRVGVAISDKADAEIVRKYPGGLSSVRARNEAIWNDQLRKGRITQVDLERRRKSFDDVEATLTRAAGRRKRAQQRPLRSLDASGMLESDPSTLARVMGAETDAEAAKKLEGVAKARTAIAASAARQPPLSDEERAVVQGSR